MPVPSYRVPVKIARGTYANLSANLAELQEGEIVYANDENSLYVVESGVLTKASADISLASIDELSDVTITSAANEEILQYNGTAWVNAVLDIDALADVDTSTIPPGVGQVLKWDGTNWTPADDSNTDAVTSVAGKTGAVTLVKADITDFSDGDYATAAQGTLADSATQPGDNISTLTNDAAYITSAGAPVQSVAGKTGAVTLVKADITDFSDGDYATSAQGLLADSAVQPTDSINTLADVTVTTPSNGEALVWNGSAWVNSTVSSVGSIDDLSDVDTTTSAPTSGQVLEWDGTNWVPATISGGGGGISQIQDATDYEPYYLPGGARYTWATGSNPGNGRWYLWTGTQLSFGRLDADGVDRTTEITAATGSIFWSYDGLNWNEIFFSGSPTQTYTNTYRVDITSGPSPATGGQIYLYFSEPVLTPQPLNDGEILQWKSANSKFRPQAIATVATSGSYNDLADLPTLGTAAATDSTAYATAAQGTLADSAVQPTDSIDALADVDTTTNAPTSGQVLQWDGTNWVPATQAPGGVTSIIAGTGISVDQATGDVTITATGGGGVSGIGVATRVSDSGTAASSALTLTGLGSSGQLHTISTDLDAWVVFYGSAADRTADAGRAYNTDPAAGSGVLAEAYVTTAGAILFTPGTGYMNNDTTETSAIYLAVRDQAGAAVNATLTVTAYVQGGYTGVSGGTFGSG